MSEHTPIGKVTVRRSDREGLALAYVKFSDKLGLALFTDRDRAEFFISRCFGAAPAHRGEIIELTYEALVDELRLHDEISYVFINPVWNGKPDLLALKEDVIEAIEGLDDPNAEAMVQAHTCLIDYSREGGGS